MRSLLLIFEILLSLSPNANLDGDRSLSEFYLLINLVIYLQMKILLSNSKFYLKWEFILAKNRYLLVNVILGYSV